MCDAYCRTSEQNPLLFPGCEPGFHDKRRLNTENRNLLSDLFTRDSMNTKTSKITETKISYSWLMLFIYLPRHWPKLRFHWPTAVNWDTDIFSLLRRQRQMCMLSRLSPFVGVQLWWVLHLEHRRSLQDKFVTWWLIYIVTLICGGDNSCYMIIDTIYLNILSLIMS